MCEVGIICLSSYIINTEGLEGSVWRYSFENLFGGVGFQTKQNGVMTLHMAITQLEQTSVHDYSCNPPPPAHPDSLECFELSPTGIFLNEREGNTFSCNNHAESFLTGPWS